MSPQKYFPDDYVLIPASEPYSQNTFYKISMGQQKINDRFYDVVKIEMIFNKELGRGGKINPAFPCDSDDLKMVLKELLKFL
ncbi:hypothetical protein CQZ94_27680 [Bacillus sp. MYb209]|uniref:hypothetical protein n=1 Tax=Bacillus sp. MYb209 TaxID=1848605 RepID=UPI000CFCE752|nr:hypothetical protein [Bacillus sp. MYb209]PQZ48609.1 hypothetical protein CQZ94_27680 [Bacillus sp. MYb209]